MSGIYKYRVFCLDENEYVTIISNTIPSECPNNSSHNINSDLTSVIQTLNLGNSLDIIPRKNDFNKSSYKRLSSNVFPGTSYASAKCVSYMSSSSSYSIQIFDKNNHQILLEKTFTNTEESIQDLGVLTNLSSDLTQLEISGKVTGGGKAYLESVIICYN